MKVEEKWKLSVIGRIDKFSKYLEGTQYHRDMSSMRKKYIYKDISPDEFLKDVRYLRNIKNIFNL